jgi:hypothetical protein
MGGESRKTLRHSRYYARVYHGVSPVFRVHREIGL